MPTCYICNNSEATKARIPNQDAVNVDCPVCGRYALCLLSMFDISGCDDKRWILSAVLRANSESGKRIKVAADEICLLLESAAPPKDPIESIDRLLVYVVEHSEALNRDLKCDVDVDYPIIFARDRSEFEYVVNTATEMGYLRQPCSRHGNTMEFRLTIDGWKRYSELKKIWKGTNQAFVAMWFKDDEVGDAWRQGIKPALEAVGYAPIRIDMVPHNDDICDRMIAEIRKSSLLVADFTGSRGGVYFEAGFAMGLGIPVIWTCHHNWLACLHFDTEHYNHIIWKTPNELYEKLLNRIEATIPGRVRRNT